MSNSTDNNCPVASTVCSWPPTARRSHHLSVASLASSIPHTTIVCCLRTLCLFVWCYCSLDEEGHAFALTAFWVITHLCLALQSVVPVPNGCSCGCQHFAVPQKLERETLETETLSVCGICQKPRVVAQFCTLFTLFDTNYSYVAILAISCVLVRSVSYHSFCHCHIISYSHCCLVPSMPTWQWLMYFHRCVALCCKYCNILRIYFLFFLSFCVSSLYSYTSFVAVRWFKLSSLFQKFVCHFAFFLFVSSLSVCCVFTGMSPVCNIISIRHACTSSECCIAASSLVTPHRPSSRKLSSPLQLYPDCISSSFVFCHSWFYQFVRELLVWVADGTWLFHSPSSPSWCLMFMAFIVLFICIPSFYTLCPTVNVFATLVLFIAILHAPKKHLILLLKCDLPSYCPQPNVGFALLLPAFFIVHTPCTLLKSRFFVYDFVFSRRSIIIITILRIIFFFLHQRPAYMFEHHL